MFGTKKIPNEPNIFLNYHLKSLMVYTVIREHGGGATICFFQKI